MGPPDYPFDEAWLRELGELMWNRCWYSEGTAHQLAAMGGSPDAGPAPRSVANRRDPRRRRPAHHAYWWPGADRRHARAWLRIFPGMGHDLPRALWPEIVDLIAAGGQIGG